MWISEHGKREEGSNEKVEEEDEGMIRRSELIKKDRDPKWNEYRRIVMSVKVSPS